MATRVEIACVTDLPTSLREAVLRTSLSTFSGGVYDLKWITEGDWQVTVWEDDTWVSVQQIFERIVYVDGCPIPVAGLGNLMTLPEWRNCGYGTRAFIAAMAFIHQHFTCQYAMMFCVADRAGMFEKLGWQVLDVPVTCWQSSGPHTFNGDFQTLVCCLRDVVWPDGAVDLRGRPW